MVMDRGRSPGGAHRGRIHVLRERRKRESEKVERANCEKMGSAQ